MLPIMLLEPNVKTLAFNSFLQLNQLMLGYYDYVDKGNFCVACLVIFVLLVYSLGVYLVIFGLFKKSYTKNLLNFTKFKASSFFFESFTRIMRDFLNAFFQAYFIFDYKKQITSLMASQIVYIFLCIYFRKNFINSFLFIFSTLYYILFFLFNVILVVQYLHPNFFDFLIYDKFM